MNALHRAALFVFALAIPLIAASSDTPRTVHEDHASFYRGSPLVDKVRASTRRYRDVNVAIAEQWVPATPCVSGPNEGAMGVHYVFGPRLRDGVLNAEEPEALIYEPLPEGGLRLVGVEFIVFASDWEARNPAGGAPNLDGHLMHYVGAPNRYGLDAFYEIHVWAWERNPKGHFADWNTQVTCNRQPGA